VKGTAAPELVYHPERRLHALIRTKPKGAGDPGWRRIGWDEALDTGAARLCRLAREHGPESVVFGTTSPSTSAMSDGVDWLQRLRRAFGSPNLCTYRSCADGAAGMRATAPPFTAVVKARAGRPAKGRAVPWTGGFCCSMYWGTMLSGAPPTDPAK
jgi:anaerobic selenocysteine-containing dehydrogenase